MPLGESGIDRSHLSPNDPTRPSEVDYLYSGPAGEGTNFAPGFDLANYTTPTFANFPTANVQVADDIRSPLTREFTLGLGRELGPEGLEAFLADRDLGDGVCRRPSRSRPRQFGAARA